jgi:cell division protein FtsX
MVVELDKDEPDSDRLDALFGTALQWGLLQTVFMIAIVVMMVGLRGLI